MVLKATSIQLITKAYAGSEHMLISLSEVLIKYVAVGTRFVKKNQTHTLHICCGHFCQHKNALFGYFLHMFLEL